MNPMLILQIKFLIGCILSLTLLGCNRVGPGTNISNNVWITVVDQNGMDLLAPNNPAHLDLEQVKVYYELHGVKTEINRGNLDSPKMFGVVEPSSYSNNYRVLLHMNIEDDSEITTTYFEWGPNRTDIFKSLVDRPKNSNGSVYGTKVWFNDELICESGVDTGQCGVTIVYDR